MKYVLGIFLVFAVGFFAAVPYLGKAVANDLPFCSIDSYGAPSVLEASDGSYEQSYKAALNDVLFDLADFVDETLAKEGAATSDSVELMIKALDDFGAESVAVYDSYRDSFAEDNPGSDILAQVAFDDFAERELIAVQERAEYAFSLALFADIEVERNRLLIESVEDIRSEFERYVQYLLVTLQAMKGVNNYLPCVCDSCQ